MDIVSEVFLKTILMYYFYLYTYYNIIISNYNVTIEFIYINCYEIFL